MESRKGDGGNGNNGTWQQSLACGPVGKRYFGVLWTWQVRLAASADPVIVQVTPPHLPKAWGLEGDAATSHCGTWQQELCWLALPTPQHLRTWGEASCFSLIPCRGCLVRNGSGICLSLVTQPTSWPLRCSQKVGDEHQPPPASFTQCSPSSGHFAKAF